MCTLAFELSMIYISTSVIILTQILKYLNIIGVCSGQFS